MSKTSINIIADISVEGRTPLQIEAQLKNKINGFNREALRRHESSGYKLKEAQVFAKDPGKCMLITEPVDSEVIMELQKILPALWNEVAYSHEYASTNPFAMFEFLVEQLIDIGCLSYNSGHESYSFWLPGETSRKNPRVIEIGQQLYQLGNNTIGKMQEAARRVSTVLGANAANDLSHHWHEIGLKEWQQGKGECWLA